MSEVRFDGPEVELSETTLDSFRQNAVLHTGDAWKRRHRNARKACQSGRLAAKGQYLVNIESSA